MKKIIPSICMLLVTAVLMGTSTYAWFSMNREVKATGMQVTASTSSNLIISKSEITDFSGNGVNDYDVAFGDTGYTAFAPASSADGKAFFKSDLSASKNESSELPADAKFVALDNTNDNQGEVKYWRTETLYVGVKGVSPLGALSVIPNITVNKKGTEETGKAVYNALRIAVFYTESKEVGATAVANTNSELLIFAGDGTARTWNGAKAAGLAKTEANYTAMTATAKNTVTGVALKGLTELAVKTSYKITIVIWLEGQDADCTANNANDANLALNGVTIDFTFKAAKKKT